MPNSMTGFGEAFIEDEAIRIGFRIRGINAKGLELNIKLPLDLVYLENRLRAVVKRHLHRGRVDVFTEIEIRDPDLMPPVRLDQARLLQLVDIASAMSAVDGVEGRLDVNTTIRMNDLLGVQRTGYHLPPEREEQIETTLGRALELFMQDRRREGLALKGDILGRLDRVAEARKNIEQVAKNRRAELRAQIQERVDLVLENKDLDQHRLLEEVVFWADRLDISEELTRLNVHIDAAKELVNGDKQPKGKQFEFLLQEISREITTIGNKARHGEIADLVVRIKTEMEKVREQVFNVE